MCFVVHEGIRPNINLLTILAEVKCVLFVGLRVEETRVALPVAVPRIVHGTESFSGTGGSKFELEGLGDVTHDSQEED